MNTPARPLNYTREGNHRIFVGLGWDPSEDDSLKAQLKEMVGGPKTYHDLDLSCFLFDAQHECFDVISAKSGRLSDDSGKIYHSGDDLEGIGDGDDEQISVEFLDLPEEIAAIVFTVSIESGHYFDDIAGLHARLVDAYANYEFSDSKIDKSEHNSEYIFMILQKNDKNGWNFHHIGQYGDYKSSNHTKKAIKALLTT